MKNLLVMDGENGYNGRDVFGEWIGCVIGSEVVG